MTKEILKSYRYRRQRLKMGKASAEDERLVGEVDAFISCIDDVLARDIISLRYVRGYSWKNVAFETNNSPDNCRKIADRLLNQV